MKTGYELKETITGIDPKKIDAAWWDIFNHAVLKYSKGVVVFGKHPTIKVYINVLTRTGYIYVKKDSG